MDGSRNTVPAFQYKCNQFYDSGDCAALSLESIMLIMVSAGQNSVVLEELHFNDNSSTDPAYIQAMQQALVPKDVFVKYDEIKIESQIGEGSFGVV